MRRYGSLVNINPSGYRQVASNHVQQWSDEVKRRRSTILPNVTVKKTFIFDPRGLPTVTTISDHYFHTWCLYVRPSPLAKSRKTIYKIQVKIVITSVGRTGWIINGTHVLFKI